MMMLAASAVLFGSFLLTSLYMQNVLGTGPMETGLAFLPMAVATAAGAHVGSHVVSRSGVRVTLSGAFAVAAAGMLLLAGVDADGSYVSDLLPGMLIVGVGLGVALVGVAVAVLTGARDDETGMLSGLNTTGHEIGGSLGVAVLVSIATAAVGQPRRPRPPVRRRQERLPGRRHHRGLAGVAALVILPSARSFLPRLRLAPSMPIH